MFINEPGLYRLIFSSKLKSTEKFKDSVFIDVLPSVRKTGQYTLPKPINNQLMLMNGRDLHCKVVAYIRKYHKSALQKIGLVELQDTKYKRLDAYNKGYMGGTPDIIIMNFRKKHSGFYIELKTPKGNCILSDNQKSLLELYRNDNYNTLVSNDYDELHREIDHYMNSIRIKCKNCKRLSPRPPREAGGRGD